MMKGLKNMAEPVAINITRSRGDTHPFTFIIKDGDGVVIDITSRTYKLTVDPSSEPLDDTGNLFSLDGTVSVGTDGAVEFELSAGEADQTPSTYFFDLEQTDASSKIRTIARGEFTFLQDITKA